MSDSSQDAGIIAVVGERFVNQRLPRLAQIETQLDRGEPLTDFDIRYLKQALEDAQEHKALIERNPGLQEIAGQLMHLYKLIMDKAVANEKNRSS
jgi:hypothetical protein